MRNVLLPSALIALATTLSSCDSAAGFLGGSIVTISIVGLLALALIIYAIVDLIKSPLDITWKIIWGIAIWVLPFIGAIAYLLIGRK